jgi:hypothetical protein
MSPKGVRGEIGFAGLRLDGRLRDERQNAFTSLAAARQIIEVCDYSLVRSHSSLGRLSLAKHVNRLVPQHRGFDGLIWGSA